MESVRAARPYERVTLELARELSGWTTAALILHPTYDSTSNSVIWPLSEPWESNTAASREARRA